MDTIEKTYWIIGIIVGLIVIGGFLYPQIGKVIISLSDKEPFDIIISPDYINEGQYDQYDFKFSIEMDSDRNITSLKLAKSGVIVDRIGKNSLISVSDIRWENNYRDDYVFFSNGGYGSRNLKAEGYLSGCDNCFMVEEFPYKFTFMFTYSEDGGEERSLTLEKTIEIIG